MPRGKVRVVGSNFTTFSYRGKPIAFLEGIQDTGQRPMASPQGRQIEAVTPLGAYHPVEIVTGRVLDVGDMTLTIRELWNAPVWYQLAGLDGAANIVEVYERLAEDPSYVTAQLLIRPPGSAYVRGKVYHNVTIYDIDDSETVTVGGLSIARSMKAAYTHTTPIVAPAT
jgi:hypothetical protein